MPALDRESARWTSLDTLPNAIKRYDQEMEENRLKRLMRKLARERKTDA